LHVLNILLLRSCFLYLLPFFSLSSLLVFFLMECVQLWDKAGAF
jgi:hypothetical protein